MHRQQPCQGPVLALSDCQKKRYGQVALGDGGYEGIRTSIRPGSAEN